MGDTGPGYFEDIELDREVEIGRHTPTKDEIVEFARRWDPQPFHIDEEAASRSVMRHGWAAFVRRPVTHTRFRR